MSLFLVELKDRLVAQGVGTYGVNIFIGPKVRVPSLGEADPTAGRGPYLFLRDTGGSDSEKTHQNATTTIDTAQLTAEADAYDDAYAMAVAAYEALGGKNGLFNTMLGTSEYLKLTVRQNPTDTSMSGVSRARSSFNVEAERATPQTVYPPWVQEGWFQ